ncbi:unnamed protein product, partial [Staurois parvus]
RLHYTADEKRDLAVLFTTIIAFPCCVYCGRPDIVNAGSGESGYSECGGPERADIVNAGSGESGYSECGESGYSECGVRGEDIVNAGSGRADIVNAGSGESGYSECGVRGERI